MASANIPRHGPAAWDLQRLSSTNNQVDRNPEMGSLSILHHGMAEPLAIIKSGGRSMTTFGLRQMPQQTGQSAADCRRSMPSGARIDQWTIAPS